ncbi:MAG TPA: thioredoxin family protein [Phycisphaerae bacterium]|nr:thioredoxin family protein [Phycisphaerae bacterium]
MKIEILGTGCKKCETLAANAKAAADKLGVKYELIKVTDISKIASYGVMMTPALAIDGKVKVTGKVVSEADLTTLLTNALGK